MKITLELVRTTLRQSLGRDSFIGSFIRQVEESPNCTTACITADGQMQYNPEFTKQYVTCEADLFCLVVHELMHPLFGHFVYQSGELENIAADAVINACISQLFARPSGEGHLFTNFYRPEGIEGLLRPRSRMHQSRYHRLYSTLYDGLYQEHSLSTGEVIQTLKVLTPPSEGCSVVLIGTHGCNQDQNEKTNEVRRFPAELCEKVAAALKHGLDQCLDKSAGYNPQLLGLFIEVLKSHLSLKRTLLQRFATQRKVDRFKQRIQRPRTSLTPIPLRPSKRDLVLLAAGVPPFHYHNQTQAVATKNRGLAIYLDVSGSVNEHLPKILGILADLKRELRTVFLFSNRVVEVPFTSLMQGQLETTGGTDFNCIARSILDRELDKAIVLTDGYASLNQELGKALQSQKTTLLTVLFGGKEDCPEFAPLGDVVQLEEICV